MKYPHLLLIAFALFAEAASAPAAEPITLNIPKGSYAKSLGNNTVEDTSGAVLTKQEIKGKVVVGIFITPDLAKGVSRRWAYLLADKPSTKLPGAVALIMVQNIAAAGGFKKIGKNLSQADFIKGDRPYTVLDYTGKVFKRFGVSSDQPEILIFDKQGRLRDVETDLSNESLTLLRIRSIVAYLEKQ